ncbi:NIT2 [Candida margitis]|uniref:NIT2 n=1 Tax=Candida margitis TaxID=1775924 RepID=UPI002227992F|nr:NIT2 [Candida margitis]KAI5970919.1 NIT2 [Candida margitis]
MKVAVGQLCSSSNITKNLGIVYKILNLAVQNNVRILFLPEATDYLSQNAKHSLQLSQQVKSTFLTPLLDHIRTLNKATYLSIGIHLPNSTTSKVENVHLLIDPTGKIVSQYQKLHLFDVDVPNGPILKESNSVEQGTEVTPPTPIDQVASVGLSICYDIRFPELSLKLRQLGANILTFPSAFTTKTGDAHWEVLSKARALDSQSFVVNAAQCGHHDVGTSDKGNVVERISYGDSIIVDPWGTVLTRAKKFDDKDLAVDSDGDYYEVIYADLNFDHLQKVRTNMPLLDQRRADVFGEL